MKSQNRKLPEIDFENNENTTQFFTLIKTEYLKNLYQTYFWLIILVIVYVVYQLFTTPFNQTIIIFIVDLVIMCVLFSFYLLIHFFNLTYARFTPTIINYLKKELSSLDYKIQGKYKVRLSNVLFTCFSIIVFIFAIIGIYHYSTNIVISLIMRLLIVFIFTGITIPVLRGRLHDIFLVNLRNSYFVQIELQLKLIKHKEVESQMVKIFMTSNKLSPKEDQSGHALYNKISEKRWLQRKDKRILPRFMFRNYLFFREYATLINFKEHILNIVSAIREWDITKG
ncbi:MAG: hypothetical protein KGD74_00010 [Candidatus Lokiarchaeota archaeon]|nr:hypothetical protein [Candidatus Lokiarchaeota archaeon]